MAITAECTDLCPAYFGLPFFKVDRETERRSLAASSTLYVGNLSFYTTEAQIYERTVSYSPARQDSLILEQSSQLAPGRRKEEASRGGNEMTGQY